MDAAKSLIRLSLLLPVALFAALPWEAHAQFASPQDGASYSIGALNALSVPVTTTNSYGFVSFSVYVDYGADPPWLSIQTASSSASGCVASPAAALSGLRTPSTLVIARGCQGNNPFLATGTHTATVTVASQNNDWASVFTITYTPGFTGSGTITATPASFTYSLAPDTSTVLEAISLSTSATIPIPFNMDVQNAGTWLQVIPSSNTATAGSPAIFDFILDATGLKVAPPAAHILITYGSANTIDIPVNLALGANTNLAFSSNPVNFCFQTMGPVPTPVLVTLANSAAPSYSFQTSGDVGPTWVNVNHSTEGAGVPAATPLTLSLPPNLRDLVGTLPQIYSADVQVTDSLGLSGDLLVNLAVNGGSSVQGIVTVPASPGFVYQAGSSSMPPDQVFTIAGSGTFAITAPQGGWFVLNQAAGTITPDGAAVAISVRPEVLKILKPGQYSASFDLDTYDDISGEENLQTILVKLTVTSKPVLNANPGSIKAVPGSVPAVYLAASDGSAVTVQAVSSVPWIGTSITGNGSSLPVVTLALDTSSLDDGVYEADITISSGTTADLVVPVAVAVICGTASSTLTLSSTTLNFTATVNGPIPPPKTLDVTAPGVTTFSAAASVQTPANGKWLNVSPKGLQNTDQTLTVAVDPTGLAVGNYVGTVALTVNGVATAATVNLAVTSGATGNVTSSKTEVSFSSPVGSTTPQSQQVTVTSASGAAGVPFTTTVSGGSWLSVTPAYATTQAALTVTVDPTGLSAKTYVGNVEVTPAGGSPVELAVTLTVTGLPAVAVSADSLSFTYLAGDAAPAAQNLNVTLANPPGNFTATAVTASGGNWLSVTPGSGTGSTMLSVKTDPTSLAAGTYQGTVTVLGTDGTQGSFTVKVTLTVTVPSAPAVSAVLNAASGLDGPVSPGEMIAIFGTALGPSTPASMKLDPTGKSVLTSIGNVTVTIGGTPAPLIYVGQEQINAIVPYEVAASRTADVVVKFLNQSSPAYPLSIIESAPGIFTQDSSGIGAAAILNQDNSPNTAANPAVRGSIIQIYATGEGLTTPAGVTGLITAGLPIPVPVLPVKVFIDGQEAELKFDGEAPSAVAGIMQVNAVVPSNVGTGNVSIAISVGSSLSPSGVTVSVR
jgi:uncharacterized protein (TIGR03437 family)